MTLRAVRGKGIVGGQKGVAVRFCCWLQRFGGGSGKRRLTVRLEHLGVISEDAAIRRGLEQKAAK